MVKEVNSTNMENPDAVLLRRRHGLLVLGIFVSILLLWNGVCDLLFGYSPTLSGSEYYSPAGWEVMRTAGNRPHWMVMMAQTAGWLYPFYALSYYLWWIGMRRAGFWLAHVPCGILAYALLMIGGIQHCGGAFLSVLAQAKAVAGSTDAAFYATAERFILEHYFFGDLTALLAFNVGPIWLAVAILTGRTAFPRWFVLLSPLSVLIITLILGLLPPPPFAGLVIAPFGTWFMLVPCLAATVWLWRLPLRRLRHVLY